MSCASAVVTYEWWVPQPRCMGRRKEGCMQPERRCRNRAKYGDYCHVHRGDR